MRARLSGSLRPVGQRPDKKSPLFKLSRKAPWGASIDWGPVQIGAIGVAWTRGGGYAPWYAWTLVALPTLRDGKPT